jgi:uncharacterized protein DUF6515
MKAIVKISVLTPAFILMFIADVPPDLPAPYVRLVPEAHAIFVGGPRFRRGVVVGATAGAAVATSEERSQQAAIAQQEQAAAQKQAWAAPPSPPPAAGRPLPIGTVVSSLPGGCTPTPVGGVEYYYCGGTFYRATFQGNNLVYVTAQPK